MEKVRVLETRRENLDGMEQSVGHIGCRVHAPHDTDWRPELYLTRGEKSTGGMI